MSNVRHLPSPAERARAYSGLANARHREAVQHKLAGDDEAFRIGMAYVAEFDRMAAEERRRATAVEDQDAERRRTAAVLAAVLEVEMAREGRAADQGPKL